MNIITTYISRKRKEYEIITSCKLKNPEFSYPYSRNKNEIKDIINLNSFLKISK